MDKRKVLKLILIIALIALFTSLFSACDNAPPPTSGETRTITDRAGRTVAVPKNPKSICAVSSYAGPMIVLYGYGEKLLGTSNAVLRDSFIKLICPSLYGSVNVKVNGAMNAETVLALKTDLIFVDSEQYADSNEKAKLDTLNIPYVVVGFDSYECQLDAALIIGKALGCEEEAQKYIKYCRDVNSLVKTSLDGTEHTQYKVYHTINELLRTDIRGSLGGQWIGYAGAVNVSTAENLSLIGNKAYASKEQILRWAPDIIICNEPGVDDNILSNPEFADTNAVKSGKVWQIPIGITRYGHPNSIETPLAVLWLAKKMYPEIFNYTIEEKIKEFYAEFFDYSVTDEMVADILAADSIRSPKTNSGVND